MAIFNSHVCLPEGMFIVNATWCFAHWIPSVMGSQPLKKPLKDDPLNDR